MHGAAINEKQRCCVTFHPMHSDSPSRYSSPDTKMSVPAHRTRLPSTEVTAWLVTPHSSPWPLSETGLTTRCAQKGARLYWEDANTEEPNDH